MKVLKKTERKPEQGDIFSFQLEGVPDRCFFGRVIATDTTLGNITEIGVVLIYLYKTTSDSKDTLPSLTTADLLLPPIGTNTLPWTRGYFEVVRPNAPLDGFVLHQHCFKDSRGWYFDEYSSRLPGPVEPVGIYGLSGIEAIDNAVRDALAK